MATLKRDHKVFIVQMLACFRSPSDVVEAVKAEFKIEITRQQVIFYDPTKGAPDKRLPDEWKQLFELTRQKYLENLSLIGVSNQAYRLDQIQGAVDRAARRGNDVLMLQALEQAAKETGGMFTNRRQVTGTNFNVDLSKLDDEQLDEYEQNLNAGIEPERAFFLARKGKTSA
jgi:hypothetical protein